MPSSSRGLLNLASSAIRNVAMADPMELVGEELNAVISGIKHAVACLHPTLARMAEYYFNIQGKRFRPLLILLLSRALLSHGLYLEGKSSMMVTTPRPKHRMLAEIIEMIHTASLVHDDVIDEADVRRGHPTVSKIWGNKLAILAGDFLLARASLTLSKLENHEVTALMSTVIADLVEGEFMQTKQAERMTFEYYMRKTYLKTASLIANGCKSAAILADVPRDIVDQAYEYGKHFGLSFQLIDDLLDFTANTEALGKPTANDLRLGIATAPVLYAAEEYPELIPLIDRSFKEEGDVETAYKLVLKSNGIARTRELAIQHTKKATDAIMAFAASPARDCLRAIADLSVSRRA